MSLVGPRPTNAILVGLLLAMVATSADRIITTTTSDVSDSGQIPPLPINTETEPQATDLNGIELSNWLNMTSGEWPARSTIDTRYYYDDPIFYFQYVKSNTSLFGFRDDIVSSDILIISKFTLSFKYWTNLKNGVTLISTTKTFGNLLATFNWAEVRFTIDTQDWKKLSFSHAVQPEGFIFAIKDVNLEYITKRSVNDDDYDEAIDEIPILTGYKENSFESRNILNWNWTNSYFSHVNLDNMINFYNGDPEWIELMASKTIQFSYCLQSNQPWSRQNSTTILFNIDSRNECRQQKVVGLDLGLQFSCQFLIDVKRFRIGIDYPNQKFGLSIFDFVVNSQKVLHLNDVVRSWVPDGQNSTVYVVPPSNDDLILDEPDLFAGHLHRDILAYLNVFDNRTKQSICYQVDTIQSGSVAIEVYLAVKGVNPRGGIQLAQLDSDMISEVICPQDYFAIRLPSGVLLTLIVRGNRLQSPFPFRLTTRYINQVDHFIDGQLFQKSILVPSPDEQAATFSLNGWYYYNPMPIFDYTIEVNASSVASSHSIFYACDIVANCFRFEKSEPTNGRFRFTIPTNFLSFVFEKSMPYIRIQARNLQSKDVLSFAYNRVNQKVEDYFYSMLLDGMMVTSDANYEHYANNTTKSVTYTFFENCTKIGLMMGLYEYDPRFQDLSVEIDTGVQKDLRLNAIYMIVGGNRLKTINELNIPLTPGQNRFRASDFVAVRSYIAQTGNLKLDLAMPSVNWNRTLKFTVRVIPADIEHRQFDRIIKEDITADSNSKVHIFPHSQFKPLIDSKLKSIKIVLNDKKGDSRFVMITDWIRASSMMRLNQTNSYVKFLFNVKKDLAVDDASVNVNRVLIGTDANYTNIQLKRWEPFDPPPMTVIIDDHFNQQDDRTVCMTHLFRVLYQIECRGIESIEISLFEIGNSINVTTLSAQSDCQSKGPTYRQLDCRYDPFVCPSTFQLDQETCKPTVFYHRIEQGCFNSKGCSNLFHGSLEHSQLYSSSSNAKNQLIPRYFPYRIVSNSTIQDESKLKTNFLRVHRAFQNDPCNEFCVQFRYLATELPLLITANNPIPNIGIVQYELDLQKSNIRPNISSDLKPMFFLSFPPTTTTAVDQFESAKVCASWLMPSSADSVVFQFARLTNQSDPPILETGKHFLTDLTVVPFDDKQGDFIEGIFVGQVTDHQFTVRSPEWYINNNETVQFRLRLDDAWIDKYQKQSRPFESVFRTRWIATGPKDAHSLRVGFNFTSNNIIDDISSFVNVYFSVYSNEIGFLARRNLRQLRSTIVNVIDLPVGDSIPTDQFYQLAIELQIDTNKLNMTRLSMLGNQLLPNQSIPELSFSLHSFSVNDPCVNKWNQLENCTNNQGVCIRENFQKHCSCYPHHKGEHCEQVEYCSMDNPNLQDRFHYLGANISNYAYCAQVGGRCFDNELLKSFGCECFLSSDQWDIITSRCLPTKICGPDEVIQLRKLPDPIPNPLLPARSLPQIVQECVCRAGFINITDYSVAPSWACVEIDPCNPLHRSKAKWDSSTCNDLRTQCLKTGTSENSFQCNCVDGYINQKGNNSRDAVCIHRDCEIDDRCQQKCLVQWNNITYGYRCECSDENYTLDPKTDQCLLKPGKIDICAHPPGLDISNETSSTQAPFMNKYGKCHCKLGYDLVQIKSGYFVCKMNELYFKNLFGCDGSVIIRSEDNKPGCNCIPTKKFDLTTRNCVPKKCSYEKWVDCSNIGASCFINFNTGDEECVCPRGMVRIRLLNPDQINNKTLLTWTCKDKCLLVKEQKLESKKCRNAFEECEPSLVMVENLQSGLYTNQSTIKSNSALHCICQIGFQRAANSRHCLPKLTAHLAVTMKFQLNKSNRTNIEKSFERLIGWAVNFGDPKPRPRIGTEISLFQSEPLSFRIECNVTISSSGKSLLRCTANFDTGVCPDQMYQLLKTSCILFSDSRDHDHNQECSYFVPDPTNPNSPIVGDLVRCMRSDISVISTDYCKNVSRCNSYYSDSLCARRPGSHLFDCVCDEKLFDTIKIERIPYADRRVSEFVGSDCIAKNLCQEYKYKCRDPTACCHQVIDYKVDAHSVARYIPKTFCICPDTNFTLSSNELSCKDNCDGYCQNGHCIHDIQSMKPFCQCNLGWKGDRCETASGTESPDSRKPYKIATIVLAIVLALCLVGLILCCLKRR